MKSQGVNNRHVAIGRVTSLGPGGEIVEAATSHSPLASEPCTEALEALHHAFAVVLINAQALDGKLPSYSRAKRYIHEIERSAQRGGALLKRLQEQLPSQADSACPGTLVETVPPVAERTVVVANQGPSVAEEGVLSLASSAAVHAAPAFSLSSAHRIL
jgi:hypothetical protein